MGKAPEGINFLVVEVKIKNIGEEKYILLPTVVDSEGNIYSYSFYTHSLTDYLKLVELHKGEKNSWMYLKFL
ncbi:hypothetical protein Asulf_00852 [Archaeoglobus sulfaticallidus PM70-1]|uniref:DUF4352 domain-containing protein n=2 Tax=Archaeoglobus TaxID=2233 RepID=N0BKX1_9EURY|nr:hypothetical protein Asulf_00852 [Archaeoglobus sulfaticallidus PM70-1]